jgi:diguanylate cyclase (GGDEF)-like protein
MPQEVPLSQRAERVRLSMEFAIQQCISTPLSAASYVGFTRHYTSTTQQLRWGVLTLIATVVQAASVAMYRRRVSQHGYPERWFPSQLAAFAVGLLWGVAPIFMLPENPQAQSITLLFVACGLAANITTIGGWRVFLAFHIPAGGVPLITFAIGVTQETWLWTLGTAMWLICTISMYRYVESQQSHSEDLNNRLINALASAEHEAHHDLLTALPNRRRLLRDIDEADGRHTTLMFIDLDDFKLVNDTHGHNVGDAVLRHVATRLLCVVSNHSAATRSTVARLGGDEFAVLLPVTSPEDAAELAQQIVNRLTEPLVIDALRICIGASVGIAQVVGSGSTADLLQRADRAMYQAKQNGRRTVVTAPVEFATV